MISSDLLRYKYHSRRLQPKQQFTTLTRTRSAHALPSRQLHAAHPPTRIHQMDSFLGSAHACMHTESHTHGLPAIRRSLTKNNTRTSVTTRPFPFVHPTEHLHVGPLGLGVVNNVRTSRGPLPFSKAEALAPAHAASRYWPGQAPRRRSLPFRCQCQRDVRLTTEERETRTLKSSEQ